MTRHQLSADQVLVTESADTPFSVITPLRRLPSGQTLFKLFSARPLGKELPRLFANVTLVRVCGAPDIWQNLRSKANLCRHR